MAEYCKAVCFLYHLGDDFPEAEIENVVQGELQQHTTISLWMAAGVGTRWGVENMLLLYPNSLGACESLVKDMLSREIYLGSKFKTPKALN